MFNFLIENFIYVYFGVLAFGVLIFFFEAASFFKEARENGIKLHIQSLNIQFIDKKDSKNEKDNEEK